MRGRHGRAGAAAADREPPETIEPGTPTLAEVVDLARFRGGALGAGGSLVVRDSYLVSAEAVEPRWWGEVVRGAAMWLLAGLLITIALALIAWSAPEFDTDGPKIIQPPSIHGWKI
jgi:hypothetical protein